MSLHVDGLVDLVHRVKEEKFAFKNIGPILPAFAGFVCMYDSEPDVCFTSDAM